MPPRKVELKDITKEYAYVPGYTGYNPGYHLVSGVSIGQHSHNHLTRVWNAGGKNTEQNLMSSMRYTEQDEKLAADQDAAVEEAFGQHHHAQGGAPKLSNYVDPKYTGYFPYQQNRFGKRHSIRMKEGAYQHIQERRKTCTNQPEPDLCLREIPADLQLKPMETLQNFTLNDDIGVDLNNVRSLGEFYVKEVDKALTKPYRFVTGHEMKRFPHGYTGYLPFTTDFVGMTHGELSKVCLMENDRTRNNADIFRTTPARLHPTSPIVKDEFNRIIHGIPGYTGYKEGTMYRYGYTHAKDMKEVIQGRHPWLSNQCMIMLTDPLYPHKTPFGPKKEKVV